MEYAIAIDKLYKQYSGAFTPALDGFSFRVRKNQIMGLLGPNGAGKTTSINIICGLVKPDGGKVQVSGYDAVSNQKAIRQLIGVVPQQIALFGNLTGWENFKYIGSLYGLRSDIINKRAANLLERFGLEKHAGKRVDKYSGGMKRRANIIASLLHEPELLILDEPTAGVDVQSRALILSFLKDYHRQGKTILYTSHLLDEAQQLCDEVVIIDEGKFITGGSPQQLIEQTPDSKRLEDVFLHYTGHSVRD